MISATRLFVGNLPENVTEKDLFTAFSSYGELKTVDLKSKPDASGNENKKFAFVSVSASNNDVESCIKRFSNEDFMGNRVYVTRARESFLERLQREREQAQNKEAEKLNPPGNLPKVNPVIKLGDKLNPRKRKLDNDSASIPALRQPMIKHDHLKIHNRDPIPPVGDSVRSNGIGAVTEADKKKYEAERKRVESMKKKRQEFKEKKQIIKTGLTGIDKIQNKKVIFADDDDAIIEVKKQQNKNKSSLFDNDDDSDNELNFEVKKQFEGTKGQKVLDLQSRYKSDKRFTLDERFVEEEEEGDNDKDLDNEDVELGTADEKAKQLNILQDVLGVTIKTRPTDVDNKKSKPKLGMLRFNPMQPEHAKFLAPVEAKPEPAKKSKKKAKEKAEEVNEPEVELDVPKIEVSKEQFYKVSDTLKEAIAQPNTFSLRSLFGNAQTTDDAGPKEQDTDYIAIETPQQKKKVKNPLEPSEKNPFVYDSSDSETEEPEKEKEPSELPPPTETKAVWKENLFFSQSDSRLKEGLLFFNKAPENEVQKERRELKSLMKRRIYNNDRKNQMFKKKIGGKRKSMKKPYKNKN